MVEMSSMGIGNKPCLDIRPSEDQIQERSVALTEMTAGGRLRVGAASRRRRPHSVASVCSSSSSSAGSNYGSAGDASTLRSNTIHSHSSLGKFNAGHYIISRGFTTMVFFTESGIISDLSASLEEAALGVWEPTPRTDLTLPQSSSASNAK